MGFYKKVYTTRYSILNAYRQEDQLSGDDWFSLF